MTTYDYNKPAQITDFELLSYVDTGKSKILGFKYMGEWFLQRYNYGASYGFKFITKYPNEQSFNNPLSSIGSEIIYSSTLRSDCNDLGIFIEYSLAKIGLSNIIELINHQKLAQSDEHKIEFFSKYFELKANR